MLDKLSFGDTVKIRKEAGPELNPGALAEVCGIREADTEELKKKHDLVNGGKIYLVEFADGSSLEISENLLEEA